MLKQGKCPACGSTAVYVQENELSAFGEAIVIHTGGIGSQSRVDNYLCTDCGYFEIYVRDPQKLMQVRSSKKWKQFGA